MIRLLVAMACLTMAGCVDSPVPLESGEKVSDPALIGIWKSDLDGDPMVATIRLDDKGQLVADVQAYWEPGPKAATKQFQVVLARFGERQYMSFRDEDMSPTYSLAHYVFQDQDRFCVHSASSEQLAEDVKQKVLAGEIRPDRHMPTVGLNASGAQLREYFSKHGDGAFDDQPLMAFERVSSNVLPPPRTQEERDRDEPGFNDVKACKGAAPVSMQKGSALQD